MGTITRSLANNITTSGVILPTGITNASVANVTSFASAADPSTLVLLSTQTASSSASISFTSGIDSTYDEYVFKFINMHPQTDQINLTFQGSTDGGSNYNITMTTTFFWAYHNEADTQAVLEYFTGYDQAQGTGFQIITEAVGNANDENTCGTLQIFNPSSTTYVKHFLCRSQTSEGSGYSSDGYTAGYFNTTNAINAIRFQFSSGNIDDGIIKMYGVKKS